MHVVLSTVTTTLKSLCTLPFISDVRWTTVVKDVIIGTVADAYAEKYKRNGDEKN